MCATNNQHDVNVKVNQGKSLVPFLGCLPSRTSSDSTQMMHAWDLFLKYYETKVCLSHVPVSYTHLTLPTIYSV